MKHLWFNAAHHKTSSFLCLWGSRTDKLDINHIFPCTIEGEYAISATSRVPIKENQTVSIPLQGWTKVDLGDYKRITIHQVTFWNKISKDLELQAAFPFDRHLYYCNLKLHSPSTVRHELKFSKVKLISQVCITVERKTATNPLTKIIDGTANYEWVAAARKQLSQDRNDCKLTERCGTGECIA